MQKTFRSMHYWSWSLWSTTTKNVSRWLTPAFFNHALVSAVGVKGGTVTSGAAPLVHLNRFLCEQVVTSSGHSKEPWVLCGLYGRSGYLSQWLIHTSNQQWQELAVMPSYCRKPNKRWTRWQLPIVSRQHKPTSSFLRNTQQPILCVKPQTQDTPLFGVSSVSLKPFLGGWGCSFFRSLCT